VTLEVALECGSLQGHPFRPGNSNDTLTIKYPKTRSNLINIIYRVRLNRSVKLLTYSGHSIGTNTIDIKNLQRSNSVSARDDGDNNNTFDCMCGNNNTVNINCPHGTSPKAEWYIVVSSGGDDQSVCVSVISLELFDQRLQNISSFGPLRAQLISKKRQETVAGSAICGVRFKDEIKVTESYSETGIRRLLISLQLIVLSYDQRLNCWEINFRVSSPITKILLENRNGEILENGIGLSVESMTMIWLNGSSVNIGDVQTFNMCKIGDEPGLLRKYFTYFAIIAGEGIQLQNFN